MGPMTGRTLAVFSAAVLVTLPTVLAVLPW